MQVSLQYHHFQPPRSKALEILLNRSIDMGQLELDKASLSKPIHELCTWLNKVFCVDLDFQNDTHSNVNAINKRLNDFVIPGENRNEILKHCDDSSFQARFEKEAKFVNLNPPSPKLGTPMRQVQEVIGRALVSSQTVQAIQPEDLITILNDPNKAIERNLGYHLALIQILTRGCVKGDSSLELNPLVKRLTALPLKQTLSSLPTIDPQKIRANKSFDGSIFKHLDTLVAAAVATDPEAYDPYYTISEQTGFTDLGHIIALPYLEKLLGSISNTTLSPHSRISVWRTLHYFIEHSPQSVLEPIRDKVYQAVRQIIESNSTDLTSSVDNQKEGILNHALRIIAALKHSESKAKLTAVIEDQSELYSDKTKADAIKAKTSMLETHPEILDELLTTFRCASSPGWTREAILQSLNQVDEITKVDTYDKYISDLACNDSSPEVRQAAIRILGGKFKNDPKAPNQAITDALHHALQNDNDEPTVRAALFYLYHHTPALNEYQWDSRSVEFIPDLLNLIQANDGRELTSSVRDSARHSLENIYTILQEKTSRYRQHIAEDDLVKDFLGWVLGKLTFNGEIAGSLTKINDDGIKADSILMKYYPKFTEFVNNYCIEWSTSGVHKR